MQLTLFQTEAPKLEPKATISIWYEKVGEERLPKLYKREHCYISDPKQMGMEMLRAAASWAGHKPKPTEWREDMFGIPCAFASGKWGGQFKVEITKTERDRFLDDFVENQLVGCGKPRLYLTLL